MTSSLRSDILEQVGSLAQWALENGSWRQYLGEESIDGCTHRDKGSKLAPVVEAMNLDVRLNYFLIIMLSC